MAVYWDGIQWSAVATPYTQCYGTDGTDDLSLRRLSFSTLFLFLEHNMPWRSDIRWAVARVRYRVVNVLTKRDSSGPLMQLVAISAQLGS